MALLAIAVAVMLVSVSVGWTAPQGQLQVSAVSVRGNVRVSSAAIVNTSRLEAGEAYTYDEIKDALRRLYDMAFFDDVRLHAKEVRDGHELTIEVVERPVIAAIRISGNRKIGKGDVREKVALGVGSSLEKRLVFESMLAIKELYSEKGFYIATVDYEVEDVNETTVNLIFNIDEGVKVKVGDIRIEGNETLSDDTIMEAMETKEKGWFSRKDYNPQAFEADLDRVVEVYADRGFMEARVVSHSIDLDEEEGMADLTITVEEGPRTYLKSVDLDIEGEALLGEDLSKERLQWGVALFPGDPYSRSALEQTLENLYTALGDQGYVYAQITPEEKTEDDSLALTLRIQPQRAVRVRKIIIEGNDTTFEKVIRRELVIRPGDILRRSMIERSHREVFNLGFFEDVQVSSQPANEQGDIDLIFMIKERQIGVANVGAGYSEEFGLTGFVEFSHTNVGWFGKFPYLGLGKGQNLNLRWEFGKLSQIELSFREPWFRDRPVLVGGDIYNTKRQFDTYTEKRSGFGGVFGRRIPWIDYSRFYLRYRLERRELIPDPVKASDAVKDQAGVITTSSTVLTFIRNSMDNPFFPRSGSRTTITGEWAGGLLGGSTAYQSYILDAGNFFPVALLNSTLFFRVRLGLVDQLGGSGYIPVYELFRLGGTSIDGVRGYSEREIVPEGNAIDEGGRLMVIGSIEYRIPVVRNRAHVLAFADAGNTWNSFRSARPAFLYRSVGAGFRVEVPMMGQLGLDIAYGFDRLYQYGGPGWKTHFRFGMQGY